MSEWKSQITPDYLKKLAPFAGQIALTEALNGAADEIARLTALIDEHNERCEKACRSEKINLHCAWPEHERCLTCPTDYMIDTERKE